MTCFPIAMSLSALLLAGPGPGSETTPFAGPRDANGDGTADLADLNLVLANFGANCAR